MGTLKRLMLGMFLLMIIRNTSAVIEDVVFKAMNKGNVKIDAPYLMVPNLSRLRCGGACKAMLGCWVFTWDSQKNECELLFPLTSIATNVSAPASLTSYYINYVNGKEILVTPDSYTWEQCKVSCENLGGSLYLPPDNAFAFVMHYIHDANVLFIGMYRDPGDTNVWYDMERNVITDFLQWYPDQPNNNGGSQYYIRMWEGLMDDGTGSNEYPCLCEIN